MIGRRIASHRGTMSTTTESPRETREQSKRRRKAARIAEHASGGITVLLVKTLVIAVIDAISLYALFVALTAGDWIVFGVILVIAAAINLIYFKRGWLPAKYLAPGIVFLLIFQVFVIGYSGYIAFTNYGTGHNSTKDDAVLALVQSAQQRVPDSPAYDLTVVEQLGTFSFLVTAPDGDVSIGNDNTPLSPVTNAEMANGKAVAVPGYNALDFEGILANQETIADITVQISDDPNDGSLRTSDGSSAFLYTSSLSYDRAAGTMTDTTTGTVYRDTGEGAFTADDGEQLMPGWSVNIGADNFVRAFTEDSIRGPLINVTIWTFMFALLSVVTTFLLGLFLAIVFNDARMKGRKFYRVLMILPYAFPAFLGAIVWAGLLNRDFGFINLVLFGGAEIPWLTNEWLAKISILWVNLWLGFPYMFLVCTGALQSIPEELTEAATVDGARPFAVFRLIKFPLLLVSIAPLLISSFAFNFNNFNLIYMLTEGGPRDASADVNVGATDILISMVYKVAFVGANRDYGLASAFSIIIFVVVALIAIVSFKQTKALEDLN